MDSLNLYKIYFRDCGYVELINLIATIWVTCGGDSIGFDYCKNKIKNAIYDME